MPRSLPAACKERPEHPSLGSLTTALYGDYGKQAISRDAAQQLLEDAYQQITDADISLLANGANAYALPYVQEITDVPLQSSGFDVFDEDIPFYQMVMHGVKSYGTSAVNASATPEKPCFSPLPPAAACTLT